jgi:Cu(I)/Ag(I) efflux system periplasmic protein CusF
VRCWPGATLARGVLALAVAASVNAFAQASSPEKAAARPASAPASSAPAGAKAPLATAEVVGVYVKDKRLLLNHGPIPSLGMGAMTMEFALADRTMLRRLKKGDQVRFAARQVADDYRITHIEVVKPAR